MKDDPGSKLKFHLAEEYCGAAIKVIGIGGGGGNAINRMIEMGIDGVEFIAINTDVQALNANRAKIKLAIGGKLTKGLGSGGRPEVGRQAALEDQDKMLSVLQGADMIFLTTGLGGGTGTGASPVIAKLTAELDLLAIAVVTLPFTFEGRVRTRQAEEGLKELRTAVDTVITIPNDRLLQTVAIDTSIQDAFKLADDVLRHAVQGITDLITRHGLINLDFADVRTIMKNMGQAFLGTGSASGQNRVVEATQRAISSPLLGDTSIEGAQGVLINITGGKDLGLIETSKAAELVSRMAHPEANIIFGTVIDESMKDMAKVTVIATGFSAPARKERTPAEPVSPALHRRTPPPIPVQIDTPAMSFDGREPEGPPWTPPTPEDPFARLEIPTFMRNRHTQLKKYSHEPS